MEYNPYDLTSYDSSERTSKNAVYLINTTHRYGLCREKIPDITRERLAKVTGELFLAPMSTHFLPEFNTSSVWTPASPALDLHLDRREGDVEMKIYAMFNHIPLRDNKKLKGGSVFL